MSPALMEVEVWTYGFPPPTQVTALLVSTSKESINEHAFDEKLLVHYEGSQMTDI